VGSISLDTYCIIFLYSRYSRRVWSKLLWIPVTICFICFNIELVCLFLFIILYSCFCYSIWCHLHDVSLADIKIAEEKYDVEK